MFSFLGVFITSSNFNGFMAFELAYNATELLLIKSLIFSYDEKALQ